MGRSQVDERQVAHPVEPQPPDAGLVKARHNVQIHRGPGVADHLAELLLPDRRLGNHHLLDTQAAHQDRNVVRAPQHRVPPCG